MSTPQLNPGTDRRRFCIVTMARCGSNLLCALLRRVPDVACHNEVFSNRAIHSFLKEELETSLEERDRDPLGFLEQLENLTFEKCPASGTFGFKLFVWHNETVLRHVLTDRNYRVIVLERENKLAQYSSLVMAHSSRSWKRGRRDVKPERAPRAEFRRADFTKFIRRQEAMYDRVRDGLGDRAHFRLEYRQLMDDAKVLELLKFIGSEFDGSLQDIRRHVPLRKQNVSEIDRRFENPESAVAAVRELGREEWLVEHVPSAEAAVG